MAAGIIVTNINPLGWLSFPMFYGLIFALFATVLIFSVLQAFRGPRVYRRHWLHVSLNTVLLLMMQVPTALMYLNRP